MKDNLNRLRIIGIAEGVSFLLLLGICMPLKYIFQIPEPTFFVGMAHGVLFIAYCLGVLYVAKLVKWKFSIVLMALAASVLPFGTFVADKRIFQPSIEDIKK